MKTYGLTLYHKQGDDLNFHLSQNKTLSDALNAWAEQLEDGAKTARHLAAAFAGTDVESNSDTHMVAFDASNDWDVLEAAAKQGLLDEQTWEDDEEVS